jgi:hypothetical protein
MKITKKLKNNSGSDKFILTRTVADGEYYELTFSLWTRLLDSDDILTDINNGTLIINDGISDLSVSKGIDFLNRFQEINFSYKKVLDGNTLEIPINQQMIVYNELRLEGDGQLNIKEELILI